MPKHSKNSCEIACIPSCQKKLLKVVSCVWKNQIVERTPNTDTYFANPTSENFTAMQTELNSISSLIQNLPEIKALDANPVVNIIASNAQGVIAFNQALPAAANTFANAAAGSNGSNANEKNVQRLNVDECLETAYQVRPAFDDEQTAVTEAVVSQRTGCNGVSNTGFLTLSVQVSIEDYPFETCSNAICASYTCYVPPSSSA